MQDNKNQISNTILEYYQNPDMFPQDLIYQNKKEKLCPIRKIFFNKKDYANHQINLIQEEIEEIQKDNELPPLVTLYLKFDYREKNKCVITIDNPYFKIFKKNTVDIYKKDELIVKNAKVFSKSNDSAILYCRNLPEHYKDGDYQIQLKESVSNYERMVRGLLKFEKMNLMNTIIIQMILGNVYDYNFIIRNPNVKQIALIPKALQEGIKRNPSQEEAIRRALMYYLSIVQGPPGSGKTFLLVNLVYNLLMKKGSTEKILICAQTNQAIDNIIKLFIKYDFEKYVRVLSPAKEISEELDITNSVHKLARDKIYRDPIKYKELITLIKRKEKNEFLCEKDYKIYKERIGYIENDIIENSNIILSTLNNSADERLRDFDFSYVLIDEAAQALESDTILSLIHRAQMVCLIGDDKQLGPVINSKSAAEAGLSLSLFERLHTLYKDAPFITLLNEQFRMNEKLYEFPNKTFYDDKMITKVKILPDENIPWPNKNHPSFFYHISGKEEIENKSRYNNDEVLAVDECVNFLVEKKVELKNIGLLTFYSAQKQRFYEKFYTKEKYQALKIDTVDGFQGMEMDYIIISTVRSNPDGFLGFLRSEKRLTVALTRARKGLIIIGDAKCLAKRRGIFRDLILYYCSKGLIVKKAFDSNSIMKINEILEYKDLLNNEEEYDEIQEGLNEFSFNFRKVEKIKNENPAPLVIINQQNIPQNNQEKNKNIKININSNENKKAKNNKKEEKKEEIQVEPIKHKKKKKAKKLEENNEDEKEEEEKEDLKKKGNKKWRIRNLYNKKKNKQAVQEEEKKEDVKEEEEKKEDENNNSKKRRKKQDKEKKGKHEKKKKNEKK